MEKELEPHRKQLFAHALKLTRCPDLAGDLVQDTFLRAIQYKEHFDGSNLAAWLNVILRRIFINTWRKESKGTIAYPEFIADGPASYSAIDQFINENHAMAALKTLRETEAQLLLMDAQGFKDREMAVLLNLPAGTVKTKLFRARRILNGELKRKRKN